MGAATLKSTRHSDNEDAAYMSSDSMSPLKAFAIFDGMGGHVGGAEASSTALHTMSNRIQNGNIDPKLSLKQTEDLIKSVILEAHEAVKSKAVGELKDMGTTASVGIIWEGTQGERKLVVGNVGDSSIHVFREGKLTKLTVDDDLGHMGRGNILTQAVGQGDIEPRIGIFDILPGDQLITISDGISDAMSENLDEEFKKALAENKGNPTDAANSLVKKAREFSLSGRKMDDSTALVVEVGKKGNPRSRDTEILPQKNITKENLSPVPALKSPESAEDKLFRLKLGTMVLAKRSDGSIEDDWFIVGKTGEKIKIMNSNGLSKTATSQQLDELNPPIEKVTTKESLFFAINQLPDEIKGSKQEFTKERIIQLVEQVINGVSPVDKLTRTHGIRQKVEELMALERSRKELQMVS